MDLPEIRALVADDIAAVDRLIQERLASDVVLINQLGGYIVNSGGKRLRPLIVLLMARACGHRASEHVPLAVVVELIHTATLLHDDVVDASETRRGRDTANHIWGNEASVLVGDFLYSRAFEMMVELGHIPVMEVFARATNTIAEGEVLQLLNIHDPNVTEARYRDIIYRKTAALFEAGCRLAALLAQRTTAEQEAAAAYGRHLGTAFQLIDDALDYDGETGVIGKNIGDDLAEGKPTMPLIHALRTGDEEDRRVLREVIERGGREHIASVRCAIAKTGAIPYTRGLAESEAERAIEAVSFIADGPLRASLESLAHFAVRRRY